MYLEGLFTCTKCGVQKPSHHFYDNTRRGKVIRRSNCVECEKKFRSEVVNGFTRRKAYKMKHLYGMTVDQYQDMLIMQDGKCACCGDRLAGETHIDHNHRTKRVRAILCVQCNSGLGIFKDDPERLRRAIEYLEKNR